MLAVLLLPPAETTPEERESQAAIDEALALATGEPAPIRREVRLLATRGWGGVGEVWWGSGWVGAGIAKGLRAIWSSLPRPRLQYSAQLLTSKCTFGVASALDAFHACPRGSYLDRPTPLQAPSRPAAEPAPRPVPASTAGATTTGPSPSLAAAVEEPAAREVGALL